MSNESPEEKTTTATDVASGLPAPEAVVEVATEDKASIPPTGTPIHSLPPEILLKIFHIVSSMEQSEWYYDFDDEKWDEILQMKAMPDSASNVCTYWDSITTLSKVFWKERYTLVDLMAPGCCPLSRLSRHFARCKTPNLRVKIWSTTNPSEVVTPIDSKKFDREFAEKERRRLQRLVPILKENMSRMVSLVIATIFVESLPDIGEIISGLDAPIDPTKSTERIYRIHVYANTSLSRVLGPDTPPLISQSHSSAESSIAPLSRQYTYLLPAPPILQDVNSCRNFSELISLRLSGRAFVSFCRTIMTTSATSISLIGSIGLRSPSLVVTMVYPYDGGDTPYTLEEFLHAIRIFSTYLRSMEISDVELPFTPTLADSLPASILVDGPKAVIKTGSWPAWVKVVNDDPIELQKGDEGHEKTSEKGDSMEEPTEAANEAGSEIVEAKGDEYTDIGEELEQILVQEGDRENNIKEAGVDEGLAELNEAAGAHKGKGRENLDLEVASEVKEVVGEDDPTGFEVPQSAGKGKAKEVLEAEVTEVRNETSGESEGVRVGEEADKSNGQGEESVVVVEEASMEVNAVTKVEPTVEEPKEREEFKPCVDVLQSPHFHLCLTRVSATVLMGMWVLFHPHRTLKLTDGTDRTRIWRYEWDWVTKPVISEDGGDGVMDIKDNFQDVNALVTGALKI